MFVIIFSVLLGILILLKLFAPVFPSLAFLVFVNSWFIWLFAGVFFLLLFSATKKVLFSAIVTSIIGLGLRFLLKT